VSKVHRYHDGTKHHFHRFARSLGYLDWASQPNPFRAYAGTRTFSLFPRPDAPLSTIGDVLRHSLGLSAWKRFHESRWPLRVNPSSGNLHPTEAYVVCAGSPALAAGPGVYHYAADRHELELRCEFDPAAWDVAAADEPGIVLVVLASIPWREAWKYGERAFRYCQHDLGHAAAAVAIAADLIGWQAAMLPAWSHHALATISGLDRDEDFVEAEREEPGCVIALTPARLPEPIAKADDSFVAAVRGGSWSGRANQLSEDHVEWTFIDEIATATENPARIVNFDFTGAGAPPPARAFADARSRLSSASSEHGRGRSPFASPARPAHPVHPAHPAYTRSLLLQRRSALAFDGRSATDRDTFLEMLSSVMPGPHAPWPLVWWSPRVHFLIFVHRVNDLEPGLYLLARDRSALERLRSASLREFPWERVHDELPLVRLARGDCRGVARRVSCDQDIAADGFFSLGMIAEFDASLDQYGPSFYRPLFWETGIVGQVLYLEAEAAGARATGIGCFYDDPVHEILGLHDHTFQSLYHFTVGLPVDDTRLTTAPGYVWEQA
jgi:SagB-type dehydrogenase family enzyme